MMTLTFSGLAFISDTERCPALANAPAEWCTFVTLEKFLKSTVDVVRCIECRFAV
jgi:hypothetical protein